MTYATKQHLIDRYGAPEITQLADRTNVPPTTINDTIIDRALADADSIIDSYLSARYELPLASTPPLLVKLGCEIARYQLYEDAAPERVKAAYDAALKLLEAISKGTASLGLDGTATPVAPTGGEPLFNEPDRTFTRNTLLDY